MESNQETQMIIHENKDIFHLLDAEDERQIVAEAQGRLKEALVYTTKKWNKETKQMENVDNLSYTGIQHISIMMAQQHDTVGSLEVVGEPKMEMQTIKYIVNNEEKTIQKWSCSLSVRNTLTKMVTPGIADADVVVWGDKVNSETGQKIWNKDANSYEKELVFDDFGKNKALSKAFRNGCKVQIPQSLILEMIKIAKAEGRTKTIDTTKTPEPTTTPETKGTPNCLCGMKDMMPTENPVLETGLCECRHCRSPITEARMKAYKTFKEQK